MTAVTSAVRKQLHFFLIVIAILISTIDDPVSCIEMVEFGNGDICQICEKTLCFYFSSIVNLVYNVEHCNC